MYETYEALGHFLEALYNAESLYNRPFVLVMEEAQVLVPEVGRVRLKELRRLQEKVVYWTYEVVSGGRHRGLGFILVARRAAEVAKALVIGVDNEPFFIKVRQRTCTHGGSTPIARVVETPELSEALKDIAGFIKAPPINEAETTRERKKDVSIKQLKGRMHRLLEKANKLLETTENLMSCRHTEGRRTSMRATILNSGMPTLRVKGEVEDKLKSILKEKGKSFAEWVKEHLEIEETKETIHKKAYNEGYNIGYGEGGTHSLPPDEEENLSSIIKNWGYFYYL